MNIVFLPWNIFGFGDKIETSLNLFFFIYFQGSEFSRSAFRCHENSDPGKQIKKKNWSSRNLHSPQQSERMKIFILSAGFIAVASRGYKNWLQFEQHYSHSVFNFYFFGKNNSPADVLTRTQTWSQLRSMNAKACEYRRSELRGLDVTISARYHWSVARQLIPFHYVIGILGILPYKHSSFFPPTHGSIMLPPRQPRVFARLARW